MRAIFPSVAVFVVALFSVQAASDEGADRASEVANALFELMNAGDYASIQSMFNKEMDAALPPDKSAAFFKGLAQQMGNVQKLGEPTAVNGALVFPAEFDRGMIAMQIALDGEGLIAGLLFEPHVATKPAPRTHQTKLSLPFKDRCLVFWGGTT